MSCCQAWAEGRGDACTTRQRKPSRGPRPPGSRQQGYRPQTWHSRRWNPYRTWGPKSGKDSTYGYAKSEGDILADGYQADVAREKASFAESCKRLLSLQPKLDSKTW